MKTFKLILLAGLILWSSVMIADENVATVVASRGEVYIASTSSEQLLIVGDVVYEKDQIRTGGKSFTVLQFIDGAKVTIRPNSEMIIDYHAYTGTSSDAVTLNLLSGGLRVITGAIAKTSPDSYKVKTPVALMGVRGTEFGIMLCGDQTCELESK
jgi:hypothetical protein